MGRPNVCRMVHGIVPPYLLENLAGTADSAYRHAAASAARSLAVDRPMRAVRLTLSLGDDDSLVAEFDPSPTRYIADAEGTEVLPGRTVRSEGDPAVGDLAVDEAYDGLGATHAMLAEALGRDSVDGAGLPLEATVHFGERYDNAFWNGERMVFGDGDGEVFSRFTAAVSVIGHELGHGVVQYSSGLVYRGQSGALNESFCDVIGALVEQHSSGQSSEDASWLIGAGLFTDAVSGRALRSLAAPGSAYDDEVLGRDPQPGHLRDYVDTTDDNGGVHINSGIPNKAFHLLATSLGGPAWERPGRLWYDAAVRLRPTSDFADFATATVAVAGESGDKHLLEAVRAAWDGVGVDARA